jgi:hypothetical protein
MREKKKNKDQIDPNQQNKSKENENTYWILKVP